MAQPIAKCAADALKFCTAVSAERRVAFVKFSAFFADFSAADRSAAGCAEVIARRIGRAAEGAHSHRYLSFAARGNYCRDVFVGNYYAGYRERKDFKPVVFFKHF